jgi:hypothetical protein
MKTHSGRPTVGTVNTLCLFPRSHPARRSRLAVRWGVALLLVALPTSGAVFAAGPITFHDLAAGGGAGLVFHHQPSADQAVAEAFQARGTVSMADFPPNYPIKGHGAPGVALLDFDGDGDLDIYVTNGVDADNGLFSNQLLESGHLTFVDVASAAGVTANDQDSSGVCAGDIDNDGDVDLYVLGRREPNRLFENLGGTFQDITVSSGAGGGVRNSTSCSFGDVDGDGLLDLVVANNFDMSNALPIFVVPFALNDPNQILFNRGGNLFDEDPGSEVAAAQDITWAIALVDLDQDGDLDVVSGNDNAGILQTAVDPVHGIDRGFLRWLENDGSGSFTDRTAAAGLDQAGDWMGLAFADFDHDGRMDLFGSNTGDYFEQFFGLPIPLGIQTTRWFLQQPGGTFADPGVGDLVATPFGWGTAALDYDNDGDTDLVFYGGLEAGPFVESSNPGTLLNNDGTARFTLDPAVQSSGVDHRRRVEHGLAVGDLDLDGFPDIVSVSSHNLPAAPFPMGIAYGSVFDATAGFFPTFAPGPTPGTFVYTGVVYPPGTLAVEINSGDNGNGWITVDTLGTVGLTPDGRVNRDGVGAVVSVTPDRGPTAIHPVLAGSSYASQHSLVLGFGLGSARRGTVEVLWPGGVRNRLYDVRAGERILFPEVPCSIDDTSASPSRFASCVRDALRDLVRAGVLGERDRARFLSSALHAFAEEHGGARGR